MKILSIQKMDETGNKWVVVKNFNILETIFGCHSGQYEYKDNGSAYEMTGLTVYIDRSGRKTGPLSKTARAIDRFRRKW